jgi:hypothetical protein
MYHPDQIAVSERLAALALPSTAGHHCLTAGCSCKDPRIVSTRRARFFGSLTKRRGQTADRVVAPEPGWRLVAPLGA